MSEPGDPAIRVRRLDNGLVVALVDEPGSGFVAVTVRYRVGARDDPPDRPGLSHLVEHLLFTGSRHTYRGDYQSFAADARALAVNATTTADATTYYQVVPRENLERILWLESDRMGYMRGQIGAKELELSRRIVDGELREKLRNDARGAVYRELWGAVFPAPHPYSEPEDAAALAAVDVAAVEALLATYYAPNNAILVVAGALPDDAGALVERYFGDLSAGPEPPRTPVRASPLRGEARRSIAAADPRPRVAVGWPTPGLLAPGDAEADVVAAVLRQNLRGRLLARDGGTTVAVAQQHSQPEASVLVIEALGRAGARAEAALAAIDAAVRRLAEGGLEDMFFSAAKKSLRVDVLHRRSGLLERALAVAGDLARHGVADASAVELARHAAVDPERAVRFAREVLVDGPRAVVLAGGAP